MSLWSSHYEHTCSLPAKLVYTNWHISLTFGDIYRKPNILLLTTSDIVKYVVKHGLLTTSNHQEICISHARLPARLRSTRPNHNQKSISKIMSLLPKHYPQGVSKNRCSWPSHHPPCSTLVLYLPTRIGLVSATYFTAAMPNKWSDEFSDYTAAKIMHPDIDSWDLVEGRWQRGEATHGRYS